MKCDLCNKPATVHLTEISNGKQIEKHLCEQCATQAGGLPVKAHTPINELLTNFVMAHSGVAKEQGAVCEECGMTWAEFRQGGLMGCEHDYVAFDRDLSPLLQRAHEGAAHHVGKVPSRKATPGAPAQKTVDVSRLKKELQRAIEAEDYERAAKLRDQMKQAQEK